MSELELEEYLSDREIIAFVRSNPLLWQKRIKIDKKHKDIINQTFSQIGSLLSKPLTGDAVSTRWKNLRDHYSREMRKVTASQPRSSAGNEELSYKPTWLLFSELSFLKDVIKPRRTQSNVSRKKLKLCEDTKINDPVQIVIPSSIKRTPKNTEVVMWRDSNRGKDQIIEESQIAEEYQIIEENQIIEKNQIIEESQAVEESQVVEESQEIEESQEVEESQLTEENFYLWNTQEDTFKKTNTAAAVPFDDDVVSIYSSNMSTIESQSSTVPPPDKFYTKKKAAIEQVHGIIKSTATKINSVCDTIGINLTKPAHTPFIEEDPALVLIKSFLKKVPSSMKIKCLADIMTVLDKYSSNVIE